ncbi:PBP/GOBP family domain-containing protein [Phthorimaea operculella]|nr:PBP/GOBP family domain-containing protein [Phthorimaea operculella]
MWKAALLMCVYLATPSRVDATADIMQTIALNFGRPLQECKKEMDLPDTIDVDFINFWKDGYVVTNRATGCAIFCLSTKLDLVSPDGTLHHGNAHEFAKKHGADDSMAKQLVELFHGCERATKAAAPSLVDDCVRVLAVTRCFKEEIEKLNWTPDMDLVIGEILAEG